MSALAAAHVEHHPVGEIRRLQRLHPAQELPAVALVVDLIPHAPRLAEVARGVRHVGRQVARQKPRYTSDDGIVALAGGAVKVSPHDLRPFAFVCREGKVALTNGAPQEGQEAVAHDDDGIRSRSLERVPAEKDGDRAKPIEIGCDISTNHDV